MWFKKKEVKKEVSKGITLEEWVKDHIEVKHPVTVFKSTDKGYKEIMHAYGVNEIHIGKLEQLKSYRVERSIKVIDEDSDEIVRYYVLVN